MRLAIQTWGDKGSLPDNAPAECKQTTTKSRIILLKYLEKHKVDVPNISTIQVKLIEDMREFYRTGKMNFPIYHADGVFGFINIQRGLLQCTLRTAWYQAVEIDSSIPWVFRATEKSHSYVESCYNVKLDENNRIIEEKCL